MPATVQAHARELVERLDTENSTCFESQAACKPERELCDLLDKMHAACRLGPSHEGAMKETLHAVKQWVKEH